MQEERVARMEGSVRNLEVIILGPPTLEDKLRGYIDGRDAHKARNAQEDDAMIRQAVREEKDYRDAQHADNQQQFRQLFRLVYVGVGILIALHGAELLILELLKR